MQLSPYIVKDNGSIVYLCSYNSKEYTVWGIRDSGFIHGMVSYFRSSTMEGVYIDIPSSEEIGDYFAKNSF
jgi:hypothetical protein